jgi:hypothetical protein
MKNATAKVHLILLSLLCFAFTQSFGQSGPDKIWKPITNQRALPETDFKPDIPALEKGTAFELDMGSLQAIGETAKKESGGITSNTTIIWLPLPNGNLQRFKIWESPLMEPGLAAMFPEIKTYLLKGVDDPTSNGRMMISPSEFSAFFASLPNKQEVIIRKILKSDATRYLSFWSKDDPARKSPIGCLRTDTAPIGGQAIEAAQKMMAGANETGDVLRVFRMAMTMTGAMSQLFGWSTKSEALSAIVSFLGQINTVYERDISVRFVLPVGEEKLIFLDDATDPFVAYGGGESANENIIIADQLIGADAFDIGLVFVTGGCCAAGKPSICGSRKAWNYSAFGNLQVTAHEIGHQFDANHTWTSCGPGTMVSLVPTNMGVAHPL